MYYLIKYGDWDGRRSPCLLKYRSERLARIHYNKLFDSYQRALEKGIGSRFTCLLITVYSPEDFKKEDLTCTQKSKK